MGSLKAIFSKRFGMQFQPIVDMKTLQLARYEALMRPLSFTGDTEALVNRMEKSGEISEFDLWVLDTVINTLKQIPDGPEVAVNLSAKLTTAIQTSASAQRLITTAVNACHARGMKVVAEHIDNPMQYAWLRDAGIDHGQGWLFSKAGKELRREMCYKETLRAAVEKDREGAVPSAKVITFGSFNPP